MQVHLQPFDEVLAQKLLFPASDLDLFWLGQAGFLVRTPHLCFLIDPYLSDRLARKYAGAPLSHERLMPAPIELRDLVQLDFILCTHRHGDHLDPDSVAFLLRAHPACRLVLPAAELNYALTLGLSPKQLMPAEAGAAQRLARDLLIKPVPAAHETFQRDPRGLHHFLGYIIQIGGSVIYHSGDSIPYAGLAEELARHRIDLALLPVNGRDAYRNQQGVPGNFTLSEAIQLCREAAIPVMIAHHFGMFDFNSLPVAAIEQAARAAAPAVTVFPARPRLTYRLTRKRS